MISCRSAHSVLLKSPWVFYKFGVAQRPVPFHHLDNKALIPPNSIKVLLRADVRAVLDCCAIGRHQTPGNSTNISTYDEHKARAAGKTPVLAYFLFFVCA